MSMQTRQPSGSPAGGQFSPGAHSEADIDLGTADAVTEPTVAWGQDLNDRVNEKLIAWAEDLDDNWSRTTVGELLEIPEDDMIAAYGEPRSDWLHSLKVSGTFESRQTSGGSWDAPPEWAGGGNIVIRDADGVALYDIAYSHEDPPAGVTRLAERCPVAADGTTLYDPTDPGWSNRTFVNRPAVWVANGFQDPTEAAGWDEAGLRPSVADEWAESGFSAGESAGHVAAGRTRWQADALRRREAEAAAQPVANAA